MSKKEITTAKDLLKMLVAASNATKAYIPVDDHMWHDIGVINPILEFQITNLAEWCKLLGKNYKREDWTGNEHCGSNHDIIYFKHQGVTFFQLVDKENIE